MNVQEYYKKLYEDDVHGLSEWADQIYRKACGDSFDKVKNLSAQMGSELKPITDEDLEWIITALPLHLFNISEELNKLRLRHEFTKLKNKRDKAEDIEKRKKSAAGEYLETEYSEVEASLVTEVFASVIHRIENEVSAARELIMGAKKVWDSRRKSEGSNPIGEQVPEELPDYGSKKTGQYIK